MNEEDMTEAEYEAAYPFVVAMENKHDGSWVLTAHPTMPLALRQPRLPGCQPVVFGSWDDYRTWKAARTAEKAAGPPLVTV